MVKHNASINMQTYIYLPNHFQMSRVWIEASGPPGGAEGKRGIKSKFIVVLSHLFCISNKRIETNIYDINFLCFN